MITLNELNQAATLLPDPRTIPAERLERAYKVQLRRTARYYPHVSPPSRSDIEGTCIHFELVETSKGFRWRPEGTNIVIPLPDEISDEDATRLRDLHNPSLDMTVRDLLSRYPDGFVVGYSGTISKVLMASSHFSTIAVNYPVPPSNGGYIVVESERGI